MTTKSRIEWTEHTWNPVTGCTNVSPGCKHCHARSLAERLKAMGAVGYANGFAATLHPERLLEPEKRKRPTVYFVNSTTDPSHDKSPTASVDEIVDVIERTPQHRYQILTKRADRMLEPEPEFVRFVPERLDHGVLYLSMEFATASHLCCCGCGSKVVTPFTPTDWRMTFDGWTVTLPDAARAAPPA